MKKLKLKNQKGFTILESIVAILILSLAISGAFSAVQQSLSQSIIAKDEVKAFFLAQEAVEIIRNKRESNQLAKINALPNTWLTNIAEKPSDPCYFGKICLTDSSSMSFVSCGVAWNSCPNLKQDSSSFLYNYSVGDDTNFKREIQLEPVSYDDLGNLREISVTVRITWNKGAINKEFKIKTLLFNWI